MSLFILTTSGWSILAIYYRVEESDILRFGLIGIFISIALFALISLKSRPLRPILLHFITFLITLFWFFLINPSNEREWQTDVSVLAHATIKGNLITVHNIRNFDYHSENDYEARYYDKTFDIQALEGVDLIASYWMGPKIAHIFLSFVFKDGKNLAISIETRKEKNEEYSTIKGFFRQYELYYVVADERDVIRLRTNYRKNPPEDVYLYHLKAPLENGRLLFVEYIHQMNSLYREAKFYNTLTSNCTIDIWFNSLVIPDHLPFNWKILLSGYLPQYIYDNKTLETYGLSFEELQKKSYINERAHKAGHSIDFSRLIREANLTLKH